MCNYFDRFINIYFVLSINKSYTTLQYTLIKINVYFDIKFNGSLIILVKKLEFFLTIISQFSFKIDVNTTLSTIDIIDLILAVYGL